MSVRAHTRRDPAKQAEPTAVEIQLPWWAIALPAIAFAALLLLILNPVDAHAASGEPVVTHLFERVKTVFASLL
ncbi:hypothetical protein AB0I84_27935 [Streptomyces spectabilis]|uniref:Anti-sigma-K factor RskA n=1 Tax=Streptomyces spectabilis TaxID=68270 RepID=A0A5P2X288_STRST|nr:hypothetical protein [Streptomyces spectabilis]MBB5108483.1 anti-sigma-K factor RskA [Streptomyces spectabilis]MCI3901700.1 hypothetical protein [Streptomyces spectabilis]QEV59137.1 hypothetical protein CP982_10695 [Streptomyces spectabilis]GGV47613.1 hypothetical protein GCM10010245_74830 [Streptomyces spectabilis]